MCLSARADAARMSPMQRGPIERLAGIWSLDYSPVFATMDIAARMISPYDSNPFGTNPLSQILAEGVDLNRLALSLIHI